MADFSKVLNQLLQGGAGSSFAGGLAGGLAGSLLSGKAGRKLGKNALQLGGMAAIAALAYTAYKKYSGGGQLPPASALPSWLPAPEGGAFLPAADTSARADLSTTLVRAMIAAARADKRLDSDESQAIFGRIESLDMSPEERAALVEEMDRPVNMDAIVGSATTPEIASEVYAASLLAIDVDDPAEHSYLAMLAARLKLPKELVAELHRQLEGQPAPGR